jgi:hypothetical protein
MPPEQAHGRGFIAAHSGSDDGKATTDVRKEPTIPRKICRCGNERRQRAVIGFVGSLLRDLRARRIVWRIVKTSAYLRRRGD